jgi:hypothetical protein
MGRSTHPQVMESALRWSDGRRIFMGQSPVEGEMLFRMEADPLAVDESVLTLLDALEAAMVAARAANHARAVIVLHKAS